MVRILDFLLSEFRIELSYPSPQHHNTAQQLHLIHFPYRLAQQTYPINFHNYLMGVMSCIDKSVTPVAQIHRQVPFHVCKDVENVRGGLEILDIIKKVEGLTPWVSPIVAIPKTGGVCFSIDMWEANCAIKWTKHPMPTINNLIVDLNGAAVFSKLDIKTKYHQLKLDEASRYISTFTTLMGLRRYKRLLFGVNAAAEIFQNTILELM